MSRTRRPLAALAMVAMVAVISAGCGTGSGGDNKKPATPPAGSGSSGGNNKASPHAKAVRFAECMRNNGVAAFPDPDSSGKLTLDGVVNGSSVDPNSTAWKQAINTCKHLEPAGFTGTKATPKQMTARLEFAQCIRDNGVRDFPDPTRDGPLIDTNRIPSAATNGGMNILHAAMQKCGSFAYKAGVRPGK